MIRKLLTIAVTVLLLPFLAVAILLHVAIHAARRAWLRRQFSRRHGKNGKHVLFVYSDSPNWRGYIEANILPRIEPHAVALNWSQRAEWPTQNVLEAKVFREWAGNTEFNPIAIVFPPRRRAVVIRFWQAFRDFKRGRDALLREAERSLFAEVDRLVQREATRASV